MNILQKPITSKNFTKGRTRNPDVIVIHVGEGTQDQIYQTFNNPLEQKSSHYCVSKKGDIWQFVSENDISYAQGKVVSPTSLIIKSRGGINPNEYCISIENEGHGEDFTDEQYKSNSWLVSEISKRWNIPVNREHVIGHKEIRADKTCPGVVSLDKIIQLSKPNLVDNKKVVSLLNEAIALLTK